LLAFQWIKKNKNKNLIKDQWLEPSLRRQKGKAKERSKHAQHARTKKGRELVPFMIESYLTHGPFNVVNMQTMGYSSNGRPSISITHQRSLPLYNQS
jgi:hypothetical protein